MTTAPNVVTDRDRPGRSVTFTVDGEPVTGVLAAADIEEFTTSTTFMILQSLRLDRGIGSQIHP